MIAFIGGVAAQEFNVIYVILQHHLLAVKSNLRDKQWRLLFEFAGFS